MTVTNDMALSVGQICMIVFTVLGFILAIIPWSEKIPSGIKVAITATLIIGGVIVAPLSTQYVIEKNNSSGQSYNKMIDAINSNYTVVLDGNEIGPELAKEIALNVDETISKYDVYYDNENYKVILVTKPVRYRNSTGPVIVPIITH